MSASGEGATAALQLLSGECRRARIGSRAHYLAGKSLAAMHLRLGVPTVVLSSLVGTSVFASLATAPTLAWVVATGAASALAAVLAALQTFFGFAEIAGKHKIAGAQYGAIVRTAELIIAKLEIGDIDEVEAMRQIESLVADMNRLQVESPDMPDRIYDRAAL